MDYILSRHGQTSCWLFLGKAFIGSLIQSRDAWPVLPTSMCTGTVQVLHDIRLESNTVLQQFVSTPTELSRTSIKPSTACSDLHCTLCSTKNNFTGRFRYQHVAGHMDKYLLWHQLSLVQQLNCICDTTAKGAVQRANTTGYISTLTQLLPREDVVIVV
jgi:hypothetical protein